MKKPLTPYIIIAAVVFIVALLTCAITISFNFNPPQMENRFMLGYHDLDKNYNDILVEQQNFDAKYNAQIIVDKLSEDPISVSDVGGRIAYYDHSFKIGENSFSFSLTDREKNIEISDANISAQISRLDTNKFDRIVAPIDYSENAYRFSVNIESAGRYKITIVANTQDDERGFVEKIVYAR